MIICILFFSISIHFLSKAKRKTQARTCLGLFAFNAFRQLSAKHETDNHPLCGWATKVIPYFRGNET